MSDSAVEFPLSVVNRLLIYHYPDLIGDIEKQIKSLQMDLRFFKAFLKATVTQRRKDEHAKLLGTMIHDVAYELDDAFDVFHPHAMEEKTKRVRLIYMLRKPASSLHTISSKVNDVRDEVERYWLQRMSNYGEDVSQKLEVSFILQFWISQ